MNLRRLIKFISVSSFGQNEFETPFQVLLSDIKYTLQKKPNLTLRDPAFPQTYSLFNTLCPAALFSRFMMATPTPTAGKDSL